MEIGWKKHPFEEMSFRNTIDQFQLFPHLSELLNETHDSKNASFHTICQRHLLVKPYNVFNVHINPYSNINSTPFQRLFGSNIRENDYIVVSFSFPSVGIIPYFQQLEIIKNLRSLQWCNPILHNVIFKRFTYVITNRGLFVRVIKLEFSLEG